MPCLADSLIAACCMLPMQHCSFPLFLQPPSSRQALGLLLFGLPLLLCTFFMRMQPFLPTIKNPSPVIPAACQAGDPREGRCMHACMHIRLAQKGLFWALLLAA